jgi:hypothetical protein
LNALTTARIERVGLARSVREEQLKSSLIIVAALFVTQILHTQSLQAQAHPIPPGVRQADQAEAQTAKNIPPPAGPHATVDAAKLQRDADELARLAASIPSDIDQTAKGVLPKDIVGKLKRIQKLAKQLRSELNR